MFGCIRKQLALQSMRSLEEQQKKRETLLSDDSSGEQKSFPQLEFRVQSDTRFRYFGEYCDTDEESDEEERDAPSKTAPDSCRISTTTEDSRDPEGPDSGEARSPGHRSERSRFSQSPLTLISSTTEAPRAEETRPVSKQRCSPLTVQTDTSAGHPHQSHAFGFPPGFTGQPFFGQQPLLFHPGAFSNMAPILAAVSTGAMDASGLPSPSQSLNGAPLPFHLQQHMIASSVSESFKCLQLPLFQDLSRVILSCRTSGKINWGIFHEFVVQYCAFIRQQGLAMSPFAGLFPYPYTYMAAAAATAASAHRNPFLSALRPRVRYSPYPVPTLPDSTLLSVPPAALDLKAEIMSSSLGLTGMDSSCVTSDSPKNGSIHEASSDLQSIQRLVSGLETGQERERSTSP
ncbi:hypothetical protein DNTS_009058 [Danionella cerebrum]|uniref:T-box transcription factor 2/3 repressor domain-containing protein n=1 Tax=Danionella cerebrum TaxID=2873325 RepID=A0A553N427_9TELE|nr:hypothetical protein DNTS_009058 [Danionella translucida]